MASADFHTQFIDSISDEELPRGDRNRVEFYTTDPEDQKTFMAAAERLGLGFEDLAVFCRHGFKYDQIPLKSANQHNLLTYLKRAGTPPAKWVMISGLYPDISFSELERHKRLRALYRAATLLIKRALGRNATGPFKADRSQFWDPVAEVCRDLEIAPSKLSSLMKEYCGHSLTQLIDCVRAERIQKTLKAQIRLFVKEWRTHRATLAAENQQEVDALVIWKALKVSRRWPEFCQNTWALEFGFATYRRMYRACLAVWKQTPHQLLIWFSPMKRFRI